MGTKIAVKTKNAFVQYSKRMCTWIAIFWMIYRLANFLVVLLRPEIATALVDLSTGVDTIMIVNISVYSGNSISEKAFIAFSNRKSMYSDRKDDEENEDDNNG